MQVQHDVGIGELLFNESDSSRLKRICGPGSSKASIEVGALECGSLLCCDGFWVSDNEGHLVGAPAPDGVGVETQFLKRFDWSGFVSVDASDNGNVTLGVLRGLKTPDLRSNFLKHKTWINR